ncbi:MAG: sugar transferase, partial [Nitrospirae bacterium]|nr:sugar transferase [Nitrospirota bacterium]
MLKQRARLVAFSLFIMDEISMIAAFLLSYGIRGTTGFSERYGPLAPFPDYTWLLLFILPSWGFLAYLFKSYESQRTRTLRFEIWNLLKTVFFGTLFLAALVFGLKEQIISRLFVAIFGIAAFVCIGIERILIRTLARSFRKQGYNHRNILIVGTGRRARDLIKVIRENKQWGLKIAGVISDNPDTNLEQIGNVPIIGGVKDISHLLVEKVIDEVVFAVTRRHLEALEEIFLLCEELGIKARVAVNFFPNMIAQVHLDDLHGIPLLTFTTTPHNELSLAVKRSFDIVVSLAVLLLAAVPMIVIAVTIRITSPGPVFFRQMRIGLNGRRFTLYKFRSMIKDAEDRKQDLAHLNEMQGPVFKMKDDPRLTPIGKWLRKTSLDELPQLLNVLKGDMSLVGPRPPLPDEVRKYERWQRRRLSMKPGLTCLWQISGRSKIADFEEWMKLDLQYIDTWSLKLDLQIFLKTIPVVLLGRG